MDQKRIYVLILTPLMILALMLGGAARSSPARAAEAPVQVASGYAAWTAAGFTQVSVPASSENGLSFDVESPLAPSAVCTPDIANMRAYWQMDDTDTPLTDTIANPQLNNGGCQGGLCPNPNPTGKVNSAFDFNNDEVNVTQTNGLGFTISGNMSVETWVKTSQACTGNIVFVGRYEGDIAPNSSAWWLGCDTNGKAAFNLRDDNGSTNTLSGTSAINDGNWHHVVATREGSTNLTKIYTDGALQGTATVDYTGALTFTQEINIGYMDVAPFYYFIGTLDEMALYDRVLSPDDVSRHYFTGLGQSYCNDPPIANPDTLAATEDTQLSIATTDLTANDVDPEGDAFTITAIDNATSAGGTIAGTGPYTYTPPANFNGADTFEYTISDATGPSTTTVTINVAAANDAPVVTNPGGQASAEGASVNLPITATDMDTGDVLTYSATGLPPDLSINPSTGVISGTIAFTAEAGSPYTVNVTATDNGTPQLFDTETFTWTITDENQPPDVTDPGTQTNDEGDEVNLQIQATDLDAGDTLTYAAENLPPGLTINAATGLISGTIDHTAAVDSPYTVEVTVTDDGSIPLSDSVTFFWIVNDVNQAPIVDNPGNQTNLVGSDIFLEIEASDPDGDPITFSATGLPPGLGINANNGRITGTLPEGSQGTYDVSVTVTDDHGADDLEKTITFKWFVRKDAWFIYLPLVVNEYP
jgi:hypothetical protein